jgi:phytoene synthase
MRDRDLVRLYWPVHLRPAFDALFAIDDALADIVMTSTQPALGAIRLAWWREALERLDHQPPPPEPRLRAAAAHLLPRGIRGADLAEIEQGWKILFDDEPDIRLAEARGEALFKIGGHLLGMAHPSLSGAGRLFAGIDFARRGYREVERSKIAMGGIQFPKVLRPLTALTALAVRDLKHGGPPFEAEATPGRAASLLSHSLFGRIS